MKKAALALKTGVRAGGPDSGGKEPPPAPPPPPPLGGPPVGPVHMPD